MRFSGSNLNKPLWVGTKTAYIVLISGLWQGHAFVRIFRKLAVQGMGCWETGKAWARILMRLWELFALQSRSLDIAAPTCHKAPWEELRVSGAQRTQTCKEKGSLPCAPVSEMLRERVQRLQASEMSRMKSVWLS